jgi:hypothetical protein
MPLQTFGILARTAKAIGRTIPEAFLLRATSSSGTNAKYRNVRYTDAVGG